MGKSTTSTQQVTVPPEVLARYNAVNSQAQQVAATPFKVYSTDPNAFVAPLNSTENAGIAGISAAANQAQPYFTQATSALNSAQAGATPYYGAATTSINNAANTGNGLAAASLSSLYGGQAAANPLQSSAESNISGALAGAQPYNAAATGTAIAGGQAVNPTTLDAASINQYLSPYLQTVLGSTSALLNQNNQQQQAGQLGNAITSGAFGGDRAGIAAANLAQQQQLANANIYSGILNTGYNNALSTAQQQQGVGLAAGQANRAALQNESSQLLGIGNQNYTQGLGAASAQAALGQQEYGQGATTAAQEAALGQQQFGQGLATSQQQAQLGQDIYNTGAATSQGLANLGTGAQSAALQGAQAQLGAGQVAQQTQQAGDTALYNQFLQQQSYPFQVAQFLANIAEGTGALSGSTTTTTQPGGFFSDERLKEDIEPIGKSFDGQNIYKFRYKGDPRKQIGLMAQDVEKHHPDAVGLARGYKTVDYDKATEKAAARGHFRSGGLAAAEDRSAYAYGGYPMLPGEYPSDLQAILQSQAQMYGPNSGGLYGGSGGGAPRGGSSYVPQANLPVGHLAVAGGSPSAPQSATDQIQKLAGLGQDISKGIGWLEKKTGSGSSANDNGDPEADWLGYARGGLARAAYAVGGDAANDDNDNSPHLDIPNDPSHVSLSLPGPPPKPQGGGLFGALGSIFGLGKDVASMIPGLKDGGVAGRSGFDGGGGAFDWLPDPSNWEPNIESAVHNIGDFLRGSKAATAGVPSQGFDPTAGGLLPDGSAARAPAPNAPPTPHGNFTPPSADLEAARLALQSSHSGLGRAGTAPSIGAPPPAVPANDQPDVPPPDTSMADYRARQAGLNQDYLWPDEANGLQVSAQPSGLAAAANATAPQTQPSQPPSKGGGLSGILNAVEGLGGKLAPNGGYIDDVLHPSQDHGQALISLLSGIAAMGTAPTRSLGVALATGLGAGTQAYQKRQGQLADIGQTQAQTGETEAMALRALPPGPTGTTPVLGSNPNPQGRTFHLPDGRPYHYEFAVAALGSASGSGAATSGAAPSYSYLGAHGQDVGSSATLSYATAPEADQLHSRAAMDTVNNAANSARSQLPGLNQYASAIGTSGRGALLQPGPLNAVKSAWVGNFNDVMRTLNHPEWQVQSEGLADKEITDKMATVIAQAKAAGADERSLGALRTLMASVPNNSMSPQAATHMVAQQFIQNQRDIDHANYYHELNQDVQQHGGLPGGFLTRDADEAFGNDFTADRYNHESGLIYNAMMNGSWAKAQNVIQNGTPEQKQQMIKLLNNVSPNLARYLTGGQ